MDTIVAIATPIGVGGIGIIRISGEPLPIVEQIFKVNKLDKFSHAMPNMMYFGTLSLGDIKEQCLGVYFKSPHSYTGEDVVELQCHGSNTLLSLIVAKTIDLGARLASRGEFTKRAFLNGKLRLADAEGVIDMINADSIAGLNSAYRLMKGDISRAIYGLQERMQELLVGLEASMDYPDEMEEEALEDTRLGLDELDQALDKLRSSFSYGKIVSSGINVAIIGKANMGKSSLLNCLLGEDRAIVTDIAGTTRDTITESVTLGRYKLNLIDTAGIRESEDKVEQYGVNRAKSSAQTADLVLFVTESGKELDEDEQFILNEIHSKNILIIANKTDLYSTKLDINYDYPTVAISAKSGAGMEELKAKIIDIIEQRKISGEGEIITNSRHFDAVNRAYQLIHNLKENYEFTEMCCMVLDLKEAWSALGNITGTTATEDIIDQIFEKFCLGK